MYSQKSIMRKTKITEKIDGFENLGRSLKIPKNTMLTLSKNGFKVEFFTPTYDTIIGIGTDHVAYLIMDEDAHKAFLAGEQLNF